MVLGEVGICFLSVVMVDNFGKVCGVVVDGYFFFGCCERYCFVFSFFIL